MPTCIKCEKKVLSEYKLINTIEKGVKGRKWACWDRFCNADLNLKNGYMNFDDVWVICKDAFR